ncbi:MAG TPA: helix-turn-helix transcriptional regulator [Thermoleophilaceae bacterium]|nr:helix-turn-helix transcriptional regulator [Thermoleophilaceae bacterium]
MSKSTAARFADNLRRARAESGLSQTQLAKSAGISHSEIYRLEAGTREPRLGTLLNLGNALGIEGADLLEGLGDSQSSS